MGIERRTEHEKDSRQAAVFGWIGLTLGALAVICGVGWGIRSLVLLLGAERTTGTIVEIREESPSASTINQRVSEGESRSEASRPNLVPLVEYEVAGRKYTIEHPVIHDSRASSLLPEVGEKVEILYMADEPATADVNSFLALWGGPLLFGTVGSIFAAVGIFSLRRQRKHARTNRST